MSKVVTFRLDWIHGKRSSAKKTPKKNKQNKPHHTIFVILQEPIVKHRPHCPEGKFNLMSISILH